MMRDMDFWRWKTENWLRENEMIDALWWAAHRKDGAKEEVARLAPNVPAGTHEAWIAAAGLILGSLNSAADDVANGQSRQTAMDAANKVIVAIEEKKRVAKETEKVIHVFVQKPQFPNETLNEYDELLGTIGVDLRPFNTADDLDGMMKDPGNSVVLLAGIKNVETSAFEALKKKMPGVRFVRFDGIDTLERPTPTELKNYHETVLSILLAVRIMTQDNLKDDGDPIRLFLEQMIGRCLPNDSSVSVDDYINDIVNDNVKWINIILGALPAIEGHKEIRRPVEAFWSV